MDYFLTGFLRLKENHVVGILWKFRRWSMRFNHQERFFFGEAKVRFPRFPKMGYVFMAHVFCSGSVLCIKIAVLWGFLFCKVSVVFWFFLFCVWSLIYVCDRFGKNSVFKLYFGQIWRNAHFWLWLQLFSMVEMRLI